jgi:hypothetical protein
MHSGDGGKIGQFNGVYKAPQQTLRRERGLESGWGVPNVQNTKLFCGVFLTGFLDSALRTGDSNMETCYETGSKFD